MAEEPIRPRKTLRVAFRLPHEDDAASLRVPEDSSVSPKAMMQSHGLQWKRNLVEENNKEKEKEDEEEEEDDDFCFNDSLELLSVDDLDAKDVAQTPPPRALSLQDVLWRDLEETPASLEAERQALHLLLCNASFDQYALQQYQMDDLAAMRRVTRCILAERPGSGKTAICIALMALCRMDIGMDARARTTYRSGSLWNLAFNAAMGSPASICAARLGPEVYEQMMTHEATRPAYETYIGTKRKGMVQKVFCGSRASLLVVPRVLVSQWLSEFQKFVSNFESWHVGFVGKGQLVDELALQCDLIICPGTILASNIAQLKKWHWKQVFFDDSMKGFSSSFAQQTCRFLSSSAFYVITGTPIKSRRSLDEEKTYFRQLIDFVFRKKITKKDTLIDADWLRGKFLFHRDETLDAQIAIPSLTERVQYVQASWAESVIYNESVAHVIANLLLTNGSGPDFLGSKNKTRLSRRAQLKMLEWCDSSGLTDHERQFLFGNVTGALLQNRFGHASDINFSDPKKVEQLADIARLLRVQRDGQQAFAETHFEFNKFYQACQLVQAHVDDPENGKAIVFWNQTFTGAAWRAYLEKNLAAKRFAWVRDKAFAFVDQVKVARFSANNETDVLCCSVGAVGTGVHLVSANLTVFLDVVPGDDRKQQAIQRTHRLGQTRPCRVVQLLLQHSYEEQVFRQRGHPSFVDAVHTLRLLNVPTLRAAVPMVPLTTQLPPPDGRHRQLLDWLLARSYDDAASEKGWLLRAAEKDLGGYPLFVQMQDLCRAGLAHTLDNKNKTRLAATEAAMVLAKQFGAMPAPIVAVRQGPARRPRHGGFVYEPVEAPRQEERQLEVLPSKRTRRARISLDDLDGDGDIDVLDVDADMGLQRRHVRVRRRGADEEEEDDEWKPGK